MTTRWPGGHYTMHAYGSSRAYVDNFVIESNIAWRHGVFLIGGGRPSRNIMVRENYLYRVPMQIGYSAPYNENCDVAGNVLFRSGLSVRHYRTGSVRDNLIVDGRLDLAGEGEIQTQNNTVAPDRTSREVRPVLLPNKYDQRRANLAIFNWNKQKEVWVPAGDFLKDGERLRLLDPLDFYSKPVWEGQCEAGGFRVPMTDEFAVFVVLK